MAGSLTTFLPVSLSLLDGVSDSLVYCWRLNDKAFNTTLLAQVGGINGTNYAWTDSKSAPAVLQTGIYGNGTSDYMNLNTSMQSTFRSDFTINFWLKMLLPRPGGTPEACGFRTISSPYDVVCFSYGASDGGLTFQYYAHVTWGNHISISFSPADRFPASPFIWKMVTATVRQVNPTTVEGKLYVNDHQTGSTATETQTMSNLTFPATFLLLNANNGSGPIAGEYIGGCFDQFQVFNRVLTLSEIVWLYRHGVGREF